MAVRRIINWGVVIVGVLLAATCSRRDPIERDVARLMERYHELGMFQGAVLAARDGELVISAGFGQADREWGVDNTPATKFRLGSVTKAVTASLILALEDAGLIELDATISDYLPDFRPDVGTQVTVHHLLTHSSGIGFPALSSEEYWATFQRPMTTREILESLCSEDPAFKPGEQFRYSSAGYMILGAIAENVTGKTYSEALKEWILDPAGMVDTGVDDPQTILARRGRGYQTNYGSGNARYKYMPSSFSSGSLYSTVEDLHRWVRALDSGELLSAENRDRFFRPHMKFLGGSFGYGWFLEEWDVGNSSKRVAFHGGDVSGFSAFVLRSVDGEYVVVLLSNQEGLMYDEIAHNLLRLLNGASIDEPKAYIADRLRQAIYSVGLDEGRKTIDEVRNRGLDRFNADEGEMIELGYDLLKIGRIDGAILVFETTVALHPSSPDAHDSLAEALYESGDVDGAIARYEKAIDVDPEYNHARVMLAEILAKSEDQPDTGVGDGGHPSH